MRTISKRQRQSEKEERSTVLCREVDPDYLGREVYADDVETPYAFYLVRKLNLAKDYQNLAEGEAFFDAICDSWDETEEFEELVVKKIYMYVETEVMYYTLLMGSFEPTRRELRMNLKKWFEEITLEPTDHLLVSKDQSELNAGEIQGMMKQMIETSNEIFRLRKLINELTETINSSQIELKSKQSHPIISRSIQTIHLKRAQPLVIEEEKKDTKTSEEQSASAVEAELIEETEAPEKVQEIQTENEVARETEKKLANELVEKPIQEDFPAEERTVYPDQKAEDKTEVTVFKPVDLSLLVFKKKNAKKATPSNWPRFSKLLKDSKTIDAPAKIPNFSKTEMENLEDEIYLRFMNKRMRLGAKKSHVQKKRILRSELLAQINQAEYLNYSWGQVLRLRKEDVLICGRLSCASLVSSLDEFLQEMRELAYSRSLFGKKVRCSVDLLRRLEGYILMDQYMQNLSLMPVEKMDFR